MKRTALTIALVALTILTDSCAKRAGVIFSPVGEQMPSKTGSIAVICGNDDRNEFTIVSTVTDKLTEAGHLNVLPQEKIKKIFPSYPTNILIKNETSGKDGESFGWEIEDNIPVFRKIQKKLGVDYLLVIWVFHWEHSNMGFYSVSGGTAAWLIKFPEETLAGRSFFGRAIRLHPDEYLADNKVSSDRLAKLIGEELFEKMESAWK